MTLRRPAAQMRRAPDWRRSGDESYWESLISDREVLPCATRPQRAHRPQSAIEGGQLDNWLEHLQRMQSDLLIAPVTDQVPASNDRTTSMPGLDKQPSGRAWRQQGIPSFSRASSSCGSPSLCESSLGSQESLQTEFVSFPERRASWERAHIMQAPRKEQTELSYLAPVKIGWLPIQRKVMMMEDDARQNQFLDHSAGQVKLKQPITPTFQKNGGTASRHLDGEVERSHTSLSTSGVRTQQTPEQGSPIIKQVPEKRSPAATEVDRPVGWQALRRGWNVNRLSSLPGGSQSNEIPTGPGSDSYRKSPLMKTTSVEPFKCTPLHQTSAEPCRPHILLKGTNSTETYKSHSPLHRTSSVQPIKPIAPLSRTNSSSQSPHIQTSSAVTTLIPQSKAGFSSITISSRKVSRSASLPGSDIHTCNYSATKSRESPSPPLANQSMDPNSMQVTVQRKATIVKVTEQRMMSSPNLSTKRAGTPPTSHDLDTVVHRRKATIIKVTEHSESYSPAKVGSRTRYRHSYTEGLYKENSMLSPGNHSEHNTVPSFHQLDSPERPYSAIAPNTSTSDPDKNGGTLHTSTLRLFVSNTPAIAAPATSELLPPKAVGQKSDRPRRPASCYGNMFGLTEPSKENVTQPAARKLSFGLPQETNINPVNSRSSLIRPGTAMKEAGQLVVKPNGGEEERPPEDAVRRSSPCLNLIKAPDPHSHQSPEEVLALNAAAIIANIKLQRQLSKKKTPIGNSEDSAASPQGNTVNDEGKRMKPCPDQSQVQRHYQPHAGFVPLSLDPERSAETISLQEALQKSRPDFISRSQGRVRELERRAQERRDPQSDAALRQRRAHSGQSTSLNAAAVVDNRRQTSHMTKSQIQTQNIEKGGSCQLICKEGFLASSNTGKSQCDLLPSL
ncbi:hypothetical protein PAMP_010171 [Pampus punctatissimus]